MSRSRDELDDALRKGLGRAWSVVGQDRRRATLDRLIAACLINEAYDPQSEGSRASYLYDLTVAAEAREVVVDALFGHLLDGAQDWDCVQRIELAGLLGREEPQLVTALKDAMRTATDSSIAVPSESDSLLLFTIADTLIALDPVDGALVAFSQFGQIADADDAWQYKGLLETARQAGGERLDTELANRRRADAGLEVFLTAVDEFRPARGPARPAPASIETWEQARTAIERQVRGTGQMGAMWRSWGIKASDEEFRLAAEALVDLPRSDVELLMPYLAVFAGRAFPLDPTPLIELLDDDRDKVAWFAANALKKVHHPLVREAALRMASGGPMKERSIDLLGANWMVGDETFVERTMFEIVDREHLHTFGFGLVELAGAIHAPALASSLIELYERTPCANCRYRAVAELVALDALPDAIRQECAWDSYPDTRALVAAD